MIYQMDPSGVFVDPHRSEGRVPNLTNLWLPPTVDGASPTTPLVRTDGGYCRLFSRRQMPQQI
jgi:hypothetical protein